MPIHEIEICEHIWIEMSDGVRLSAKMWRPVNALQNPVPAILEFIPYRKRDGYAIRDHRNHAWMAARGYAGVRPDMRGHGDSEGVMLDEYSQREQQDTVEIIEWIAAQDWCSGTVGMMGLSWGGIAAMQAAIRQPKALKAIIPVGASVDRYYDDGGYLVGGYPGQGLGWGGVMFGYCIRPPDPAVVGDAWREMWMQRLANTPMFAEKWMKHQLRDKSWIEGSVCEAYEKIKVPVLGVSGWNDCWPNTMLRLLGNIDAPCRAVSGAWGHVYPNLGGPGPMIGFLQLALDWWDHWLKDVDNGVMDAPAFTAFLQSSHAPDPNPTDRPGRWVGETIWPSPNIHSTRFYLQPNTPRGNRVQTGSTETGPTETGPTKTGSTRTGAQNAGLSTPDAQTVEGPQVGTSSSICHICSPVSVGLTSGEYMPISGIAELPQDQRPDDAMSVCFDAAPALKPLEFLGTPKLHLRLSSDCTHGLIAARLCDVGPDGASTLISYGILNLRQRDGREKLAEIIPDAPMDVTIRMNDTGWSLQAGHQLRLALSSQMWPMAWPVAENACLTLDLGACSLELPVRDANTAKTDLGNPFAPPEAADAPSHQILCAPTGSRQIHHDIESDTKHYAIVSDSGNLRFSDIDLTYGATNKQVYSITDGDPLSARMEYEAGFSFARADWQTRTHSRMVASCDADNFYLQGRIEAFEKDQQVFERDWDITIPRLIF